MKKYNKIRHIGTSEVKDMFIVKDDHIVVEEKVDGANIRFWWDVEEKRVVFGSRNVNDISMKSFGNTITYIQNTLKETGEALDPDVIYVGEAMKKHTLEYDWDNIPVFIGYDILHKDTGLPVHYKFAIKEFKRLGLPFVNIKFEGTIHEFEKHDITEFLEESAYRKGKPEGIVIKNYNRLNQYGRPLFCKVVNESFQEKNKAAFGIKKIKKSDTPLVVETYCTEARIRKIILKLINEQEFSLDKSLIGKLIPMVIEDILEENIIEIYQDKRIQDINFKLLHKLVPQKCLKVLDAMLIENSKVAL